MRWQARKCLVLLALSASMSAQAADVTVYAAASLTNALKDISAGWKASHKADDIKSSFAASSTLAKQIEAGAPADIFASADLKWMDYLSERGLIDESSRRPLLGNTLVLIAPAAKPLSVNTQKGAALPKFSGKLCMGEPGSVPAGIYGKQALQNLGWWGGVESRVVATEDVRTALAFVERAECPLGIVYETDARISSKVVIAGRFPAGSHDAIVYPVALLPKASAAAKDFFNYLQSDAATAVFQRYGFTVQKP
ncbi:MAG: molybdate ABC transporter substrate-binding protein [Moraxellaceae bacterium]